jgi:hypothetical protein
MRSSLAIEFQDQEKNGQSNELYENIYTEYGKLAVEERNEPFDVIIMDEAQDLLRPGVLEVLELWLKGGLADGTWAVFGDFQRQAIFSAITGNELKALLKVSTSHFTKVPLKLNCRNTRNIGEETALLSGFGSPPYRMGQITGLPVDYRYYHSPESQRTVLNEVLRRLLADDVRASDIVVISPLKLSNSGVAGIDGGDFYRILESGDLAPAR